jgi:hypothetical protein
MSSSVQWNPGEVFGADASTFDTGVNPGLATVFVLFFPVDGMMIVDLTACFFFIGIRVSDQHLHTTRTKIADLSLVSIYYLAFLVVACTFRLAEQISQ